MDLTPYIGPVVTIAIFLIGGYATMKNAFNQKFNEISVQIAALSTQVEDLKDQVEKHNNVVERTYVNERDLKTAFNILDELKARDDKLEQKMEKLHG